MSLYVKRMTPTFSQAKTSNLQQFQQQRDGNNFHRVLKIPILSRDPNSTSSPCDITESQ